jgi:hypothetical protein
VADWPEQSDAALVAMFTVGVGWIETETAAVEEPQALVPVTTKVVEVEMVNGVPLLIPPVQLYPTAPLAVTATVLPGHTPLLVLVLVTESDGTLVATVTVTATFELQPAVVVPATEYDVLVIGETVMVLLVGPVFHAYAVPPKAVSVNDEPLHTEGVAGEI